MKINLCARAALVILTCANFAAVAEGQAVYLDVSGTSTSGHLDKNENDSTLASAHHIDLLAYGVKSSWSAAAEYDFGALHEQVVARRDPVGGAGTNSGALINVSDYVTPTSSTLPYGTHVTLHLNLAVHATFTSDDPNWAPSGYDDLVATLGGYAVTYGTIDMRNTDTQVITYDLPAQIGGAFALNYSMLMTAISPRGIFDLNGWHTAQMYIVPSDPSVQSISACGLAYPNQPVPEPSMLALGVPALLGLRRYRAKGASRRTYIA